MCYSSVPVETEMRSFSPAYVVLEGRVAGDLYIRSLSKYGAYTEAHRYREAFVEDCV